MSRWNRYYDEDDGDDDDYAERTKLVVWQGGDDDDDDDDRRPSPWRPVQHPPTRGGNPDEEEEDDGKEDEDDDDRRVSEHSRARPRKNNPKSKLDSKGGEIDPSVAAITGLLQKANLSAEGDGSDANATKGVTINLNFHMENNHFEKFAFNNKEKGGRERR